MKPLRHFLSAKQLTRTVWTDVLITTRRDLSRCTYQNCSRARGFRSGPSLLSMENPPAPRKIPKTNSYSPAKTSRQTQAVSKTPTSPQQPHKARIGPKASGSLPISQSASFRNSQSLLQTRLEALFRSGSGDEVLLYRSRDGKAFTFWSFLFGAGLISGGVLTFRFIYVDPRPDGANSSWLLLVPETACIAFMVVMGTVVFWAPLKTLKSVTAVANRGGPLMQVRPTLVFEMSQPLPFMPKKTFELAPQDVFLDRRVVSHDLEWYSVPLSKAASFTQKYHSPGTMTTGQRLAAFNRSLVDVWPATKTAVRQMLLREGFAKVYCRNRGDWKLDMQGAELLDGGQPLKLLSQEREEKGSPERIWDWVRARLS